MPSFLDIPAPVRRRIYTYLLALHPEENETVINYSLKWNWLENPSNTTFGGVPQIDLCRCPRQKPRVKNVKTEDHMYTRYKCNGPEVRFHSGRDDLWVPSVDYANSGQINFLRPARVEELSRRPNANILGTCRAVYEEAVSFLYRERNFLFITGPCPRGRYQVYATQVFFGRLSKLARKHITACSINVVPHEEDCRVDDVSRAYANFAKGIQRNLPSFQTLGINLGTVHLADTVQPFQNLLRIENLKIELDRGEKDGWIEEIHDVESFRSAFLIDVDGKAPTHTGSTREEMQIERTSTPPKAYTVNLAPGPEALLERWRGKRGSTSQEASAEDDSSWSDSSLSSTLHVGGGVDEWGWDLV